MTNAKLVPELVCSDLDRSLEFYTSVLGFSILYQRQEERFVYLEREGAEIMLEEPGQRAFIAGDLIKPYGRGINLQIEVSNLDELLEAVRRASVPVFLPLEDKWYRRDDVLLGNRQFVVQDPDGYLLRFFQNLGSRPT